MGGRVLITGGAGFIGSNLAHRLLAAGREVMILDNYARPGAEANAAWLKERFGESLKVETADVRDVRALVSAVRGASTVFHFAAQVAVTTSLVDPLHDFDVNARGTLNLLEAMRAMTRSPALVYTSTSKLYGGLPELKLAERPTRYEPVDDETRTHGVSESRALDFHSPYGCSKGCADSYVLDYARVYGIPACVFRMSSIYGPRQLGTEDQGWVAHFLIRALERAPITIYGDGKQVRDILFVEDLVDAFLLAEEGIDAAAGKAFNIGGGPANTISLLELIDLIRDRTGLWPELSFEPWRVGDQRYYVSNTTRFGQVFGWKPSIGVWEGIGRLLQWLELRTSERASEKNIERAVS